MLRFQVAFQADDEMEAIRYARRSMIRDERTKGLEWDEPSMEDLTLAGSEIRWFCLVSQAAWCRQKMTESVDRRMGDRRHSNSGPGEHYPSNISIRVLDSRPPFRPNLL
jgi:hypothetical protein